MPTNTLRVGYVPGTTPGKWERIWTQRHPDLPLVLIRLSADSAVSAVATAHVDVAIARPESGQPSADSPTSTIWLYDEATVAVVRKDHLFTAADEVNAADLTDEVIVVATDSVVRWPNRPGTLLADRPATTKDAVELVAAGGGVLIAPQSLARLYHRSDITFRPILDAPQCPVGLVLPTGTVSPKVDEFIGIVRGRSMNSTRGHQEPVPKLTAREKSLAKQARRAAANGTATGARKGQTRGRSRRA